MLAASCPLHCPPAGSVRRHQLRALYPIQNRAAASLVIASTAVRVFRNFNRCKLPAAPILQVLWPRRVPL
jgi:hypothetical protein